MQQNMTRGATKILPETLWANESMPSGIPPEGSIVVTISRQYGCGGAEIARLVAEQSGLHYLDHQIIDEVAQRLGVNTHDAAQQDEQTTGMVGHILEAIQSSNPFTVNYNTLVNNQSSSLAQSTEFAYLRLTQRVILEQATEGNAVIVGRGSQFLLHGSPRTLHIYIFAPDDYRVQNVMEAEKLSRDQARHLIEQRDYEQESYLRRNYGSEGRQPSLYHLLINTSLFTCAVAANLIQQTLPVVAEIR